MDLLFMLAKTAEMGGSDIYIVPGRPITAKVRGVLTPVSDEVLSTVECEQIITEMYALAGSRNMVEVLTKGDDDFSISISKLGRFRCNTYKQRSSLAAVLRVVPFGLPDPKELHIPDIVLDLALVKRGMVLVTGPGGSGKTTTLACMIDRINRSTTGHIITLETPSSTCIRTRAAS